MITGSTLILAGYPQKEPANVSGVPAIISGGFSRGGPVNASGEPAIQGMLAVQRGATCSSFGGIKQGLKFHRIEACISQENQIEIIFYTFLM